MRKPDKPSKLPPAPKRSKKETFPARDPLYCKWIRVHDCIVEGCWRKPVEHCHVGHDGGMALKCSDYNSVPMCWWHHRYWQHTKGKLPNMTPAETREFFARESARLFEEWNTTTW